MVFWPFDSWVQAAEKEKSEALQTEVSFADASSSAAKAEAKGKDGKF